RTYCCKSRSNCGSSNGLAWQEGTASHRNGSETESRREPRTAPSHCNVKGNGHLTIRANPYAISRVPMRSRIQWNSLAVGHRRAMMKRRDPELKEFDPGPGVGIAGPSKHAPPRSTVHECSASAAAPARPPLAHPSAYPSSYRQCANALRAETRRDPTWIPAELCFSRMRRQRWRGKRKRGRGHFRFMIHDGR
ncbi:hypothetical protein CCHR01_18281, partial [Colletotrichum chrysophilum]